MSNHPVRPEALAPQSDTLEAAAIRRTVPLWLVIEDERSFRRYAVTADHAWSYANDAYDHMGGVFETPGPSASCFYALRTVRA